MVSVDVGNGITVRGDPVSLVSKVPGIAKECLEQVRAGTSRYSIHGVVGAHDTTHISVSDTGFESRHVVFCQVLSVNDSVEAVALMAFPVFDIVTS